MIVKVCGLKETENITAVDSLTPDLVGFIFYEKSPRFVATDTLPLTHAVRTGVFVNESEEKILEKVVQYRLQVVQLHGNETPETAAFLKDRGYRLIKAFSIGEEINLQQMQAFIPYCDYFLLDTKGQHAGGNGVKFNWELLNSYELKIPFLLSGGIRPADAAAIKKIKHPAFAGVDLNSGFEIHPGFKNISLLKEFIHDIRN
jgi:phosphoribosylanthranilate isomerase